MINLTNSTDSFVHFDDDDDRVFSEVLEITQSAIYMPILCAGVFNNLLTILIILINRDMHTVTNCYLLNLAISDTLPLIVSLPFEISVRRKTSSLNQSEGQRVAFFRLVFPVENAFGRTRV